MHHIENADCLDFLAALNPDCIDAFAEDPPYGLTFMGKGWDHAVPGPEFFAAQLRVAKPGAHLVAFGGTRTYHRLACAIEDAGWELRDSLMWLYGTGFPKSHNLKGDWDGWATALKPAWEPIILARKPFKATVAANVLAHGTGAINVDACRIATDDNPTAKRRAYGFSANNEIARDSEARGALVCRTDPAKRAAPRASDELGRWPANVVLDPEAGAQLGGASRFFYCAKASKAEREAGLENFDARIVNDGRQTSIDNAYQRGDTKRRNTHPTVKPLALMRWLVRLITPPGGLVCDPFCGSGSTGCAAVLEGFDFVGIEREAEFAALANARLAHHAQVDLTST